MSAPLWRWVTLLSLSLSLPTTAIAGPLNEPAHKLPSEPPHATLRVGSSIELGGVLAPLRSPAEQARLPWRPRETHGLFPARVMGSVDAHRGAWRVRSHARLYARPLWLNSPQAPSFQDPLGSGFGLNELSLSYRLQGRQAVSLEAGLGRWTPNAERAARPWSLEASERLWSRAPDPRDRAVSGFFMLLNTRDALAKRPWVPKALKLSIFAPSAGIKLEAAERRLGLRGRLTWRHHLLTELTLSGGGVQGGARWSRLTYNLSTAPYQADLSPYQRSSLSYRGALLYRSGPVAPLPYVEAVESSVGQYGDGLVATHTITKHLGVVSLDLGYEWRDPQLDFGYNAQHTLSLGCHVVVYTQLSVSLEQRHLWSTRDDRLSFGSSLTFAQLSWSPVWAL